MEKEEFIKDWKKFLIEIGKSETILAKELGTNVSNNVGLNVALVRDENEAMEHFLRSPKGEKVMLDFSRKSAGFKRRI